MMSPRKVRIGIVGGKRGRSFTHALDALHEQVSLVAVCDINEDVVKQWQKSFPTIKGFSSFSDLLTWDGIDAVVIATPIGLHASMAVQALQAGKHVISEVPAATTIDECWALVEAVETTGLTYMLAENYCYTRPNMMVLNMVRHGLFGDLMYAEGAYIHELRSMLFNVDGSLTWRGERKRDETGHLYPTHSIGPVAQWLEASRPGGDTLVSVATFTSACRSLPEYVTDRFGTDHPGSQAAFWKQGDLTVSMIRSSNGVLINLRYDTLSPRPHNMQHYALQGTHGSYLSVRDPSDKPLVWLENTAPITDGPMQWNSLWDHADQYEHPLWREWGEQAKSFGHGGGDFFILRDFIGAIQNQTRPPIDIYDAVTWSSIVPLSAESLAKGSIPIDIPDFTRKPR